MTAIAPGTLCFLVALTEHDALNGRVVTAESGPLFDDEDGLFRYRVTAGWAEEVFHGSTILTLRANLRPIVPPGLTPPAAMKRTPEDEEEGNGKLAI